MVRCLSVAEFADYLSGDEKHGEHVSRCARCRSIATALKSVTSISDLETVVTEAENRRAVADAAVAELEARLPHVWNSLAEADHRLHTPEGVRRLLERAAATFPTTPRRSIAFARAAVSCAASDAISGSLRFEAWNELAKYSLLAAGDFAAALDALDAAEVVLPVTDDPTLSAAILTNARAFVYGHPACAQWDGALALLDLCEPVFAERDTKHWRGARHLRAAILLRRGCYSEAAALYQHLLDDETDAFARAHLTKDLAECLCRMGRAAEALPLVSSALDFFTRVGDADTVARAMWIRGHALSGIGRHDEAVRTLNKVSRIFASTGQNDDELGAELSAINAILAQDPAADVARRLEDAYLLACALDAEQPLRSGAERAAVWAALRTAYDRKGLTPTVLARASEYLRTLGRGDEAPFIPLL